MNIKGVEPNIPGIFEWEVEADRAVWEKQRMYEISGLIRADGALSKARLIELHMLRTTSLRSSVRSPMA